MRANNQYAWQHFSRFFVTLYYSIKNEKRNITIKSKVIKFCHLAFGPNYQDMPSWYILINMSDVKKIGFNEYSFKKCISSKNTAHSLSGRQRRRYPCILETKGDEKTFRRNWARLIQKIYETDPLICPKC